MTRQLVCYYALIKRSLKDDRCIKLSATTYLSQFIQLSTWLPTWNSTRNGTRNGAVFQTRDRTDFKLCKLLGNSLGSKLVIIGCGVGSGGVSGIGSGAGCDVGTGVGSRMGVLLGSKLGKLLGNTLGSELLKTEVRVF
jgi:hypothetical protein